MNDDSDKKSTEEVSRREKIADSREDGKAGGVCRPSVGSARSAESEGTGGERRGSMSSDTEGILERLEEIRDRGTIGERFDQEAFDTELEPFEQPQAKTKLRWEGPGKIVYEPTLYQTGPEQFAIEAKQERRGVIPWGFWGGILFAGVAIAVLAGAQNIYSLWDILWAVIGLTIGALLYRYGRSSTFEEKLLCEIDQRRRTLHWPEGAQSGLGETLLPFDRVTEVVFGMTKLPVDEGTENVRVDAFALLVRTDEDELIPVVEGSPYKGLVHELAKFISETTDAHLSYVGRGIK